MLFKKGFRLLKLNSINYNIKMPVFAQKLNPILGENTWECQDEDYDYQQEIARSSFADMLHDTERNKKYHDALKLAIEKMHTRGKKAKVLDIGTGTGLLSMMAVYCGADSVIACEAFDAMGTCATKIIKLNGCEGKIKIVSKHSAKLTVGEGGDLPERANILVTEVFDTELIGEGALATFSHAHKELLEKDCIVVPNSAIVYAQVVETPYSEIWNKFKDISSEGETLLQVPDCIKKCSGSAAVHDIQLSQLSSDSFKEIIPPIPVFEFDWSGKNPLVFNRNSIKKVNAVRKGTAQVIFMWWELIMDTQNKIILSCAPFWAHPSKIENPNLTSSDIPWRDHWMQAVYYLPEEKHVDKGEEVKLISSHDQYSWWFALSKEEAKNNYDKPICDCDFHIAHSRTKIGQINDELRNKKYISVLKKYVKKDSTVLLIGDGFYIGLVAAKMGAKKILYLSDNYLSTRVFKKFVTFNKIENNVEIIDDINDLEKNPFIKNVSLILGYPYFSTTILPWDGLHFGYLIRNIQSYLPANVIVAPKSVSIKAIIVDFKDLQKIRQPVEVYEEFNMKSFDDLIKASVVKCDTNVEAQPLWEYPGIARSPVEEIAILDLNVMFNSKTSIDTTKTFKFDGKSKYNGVAIWVDWDFDGSSENIISTGPIVPPVVGEMIQWDMHTRQGVHFLCDKKETREGLTVKFNFNVKEASMTFLFE